MLKMNQKKSFKIVFIYNFKLANIALKSQASDLLDEEIDHLFEMADQNRVIRLLFYI